MSQTIGFEENLNLKLRPNIAQCYDKQLLQTIDPSSPKTALASLPGNAFFLSIWSIIKTKSLESLYLWLIINSNILYFRPVLSLRLSVCTN